MTDTRLPPAPARRGVRARMGGLASVLLVVSLLAAPPAALAGGRQSAAEASSASASAPAGETVFTLAPVGNGVVRPGESLAVSVTLENGTDAAIAPSAVTLALGTTRFASRSALSSWLAGTTTGVSTVDVGATTVGAVPPGGLVTSGITVAADDPALDDLRAGVYPLIARSDSPAGVVVSTSAVTVPDDTTTGAVGIVVPITAPPPIDTSDPSIDAESPESIDVLGLLPAAVLAELTAPDGDLTGQLDAVAGTSAILAIDPAIPAAIRVLGRSAPDSALDWLDRLMSLPNQRFALQFGDADVATQLQTGLSRPAAPRSLRAYMRPSDFPPIPVDEQIGSTPAPTPTVEPGQPSFPDTETVLDIGSARGAVYWPAPGSADAADVAKLGELGTGAQPSFTLVPSTSTVPGAAGATVSAARRAGEANLLVYDAAISAELRTGSLRNESAVRGASLAAATAHLAFALGEADGDPLLVTVDRGTGRSHVGLRTAITAIEDAPGTDEATLGELSRSDSTDIELVSVEPDVERVDSASTLFADEDEISRFATILDDTTLLTGPERAEILQLLGVAWIPRSAEWPVAVATHREQSAETLDSVGIVAPSTIQQLSPSASIPVFVRNDLAYPVNLVLNAIPDDFRLHVLESTVIEGAQANSHTRVDIPVEAQVGSGDVTIALQLRSRTSEPIGDTQFIEVTVRAEWERIGLVVLSVLVAGLVVVGVLRMVLRRRRAGDEESDAADQPVGDEPGGDEPGEREPGDE